MSIWRQNINFIIHMFLEILQRSCKLVVLGTLCMSGYTPQKWYYQLVENFRVYLQTKNQLHPHFFWRCCKGMQTSFFIYFGDAWLRTPKMIISPCRKLPCLSASQKWTSSFTSFLRYYILKNPAIWLANSISDHKAKAT